MNKIVRPLRVQLNWSEVTAETFITRDWGACQKCNFQQAQPLMPEVPYLLGKYDAV